MDSMFMPHLIVICILCFTVGKTQEPIRITAVLTSPPTTRYTAGGRCKLVGTDGPQVLNQTSFPTTANIEAWIGTYRAYTAWIRLQACSYETIYLQDAIYNLNTSELLSLRHEAVENDRLGRCVQFCDRFSVYGLSDSVCFCMPTLPVSPWSCLAPVCPGSEDFCGGELVNGTNSTSRIMVYQKETDLGIDSTPGQYCLTSTQYRYQTGGFLYVPRVRPCSLTLSRYACRDSLGRHSMATTIFGVTWLEAAQACRSRGQVLSNTFNFRFLLSDLAFNGTEFWVGIIRREFDNYNSGLPTAHTNIAYRCTDVRVEDSGSLTRRLRPCSDLLPAWCTSQNSIYSPNPGSSGGYTVSPGNKHRNSTRPSVKMSSITSGDSLSATSTVIIVMSVFITVVIIIAITCFKKKMKRRIYIGSPRLSFIPADSYAIASANNQYLPRKLKEIDEPIKEEMAKEYVCEKDTHTKKVESNGNLPNHNGHVPHLKIEENVKDKSKTETKKEEEGHIYGGKTEPDTNYNSNNTYGTTRPPEYDVIHRDYRQQTTDSPTDMDYDHIESPDYSETSANR